MMCIHHSVLAWWRSLSTSRDMLFSDSDRTTVEYQLIYQREALSLPIISAYMELLPRGWQRQHYNGMSASKMAHINSLNAPFYLFWILVFLFVCLEIPGTLLTYWQWNILARMCCGLWVAVDRQAICILCDVLYVCAIFGATIHTGERRPHQAKSKENGKNGTGQ